MEAAYGSVVAPPPRRSAWPVLLAGLTTSALTLVGVYFLAQVSDDANVMGWYADVVIPVGPLLVGLVAGLGYGIASWRTGVKINGRLLRTVVVLQVVVYVAAQYGEFMHLKLLLAKAGLVLKGSGLSFWNWFDHTTRAFAFIEEHSKQPGHALGAWGYGVRALELLGFVGGGVIAPAVLRAVPYCDGCQVYMKTRSLGLIGAGARLRKVNKKDPADVAAFEAEQQTAMDTGLHELAKLREWAAAGRVSDVLAFIERHKPYQKDYGRQSSRIEPKLVRCRHCHKGHLTAALVSGQGNQISTHPLGESPAHEGLVHELG